MTRVHVLQAAGCRMVLTVEECCIAAGGGGLKDEVIHPFHQLRRIVDNRSQSAQRGFQAGHHEGGADSLAGHVSNCESEAALRQFEKVVVISTHLSCGPATCAIIQTQNRGKALREQVLLHLARDL